MRKIILDLAVSLDGFIEGENGEIDWCIMDEEMDFDHFLSRIDTVFYGRVSYEAWGNYLPAHDASPDEQAFWKNIHAKKKYVFSRTLREDDKATLIQEDILERVNAIKHQEGKDIWLYGGASLIHTFIELQLIDQYQLSVHPVVLGKGKALYENLQKRLELKLISSRTFQSGVVQLIYQPRS